LSRCYRLLFLLFLLPVSAVLGQESAPPQLQPRPGEPAVPPPVNRDRQITLDVRVTDKTGAAVRGLQKQDFTLLDDKQPKDILSFHAVESGAGAAMDPPVEVVLVVDAVNNSFQEVDFERSELKKFLLQNGGKLPVPVSLVIFTETGTKMQNGSSRDGNALATVYDQYETGLRSITRSQGFYGAVERFGLSLKTLTSLIVFEGTRPGRKLIIWFSAGWPMLSGRRVQLSGKKEEQRFFDSIVATSAGLRQARITLYSIDPLGMSDAGTVRTLYYKEFLKGVTSPYRTLPGNLGLQVLAVQSGGLVLNSSNDLTAAITDCVADADAFYVVSFEGARADHANEYHAIGVTVDKPGITARTRTGYYAEP
jgi:VWFA-related protein